MLIAKPWTQQPQLPVRLSALARQYAPKVVLLPASWGWNAGSNGGFLTVAGDVRKGGSGSFEFPGVNGYIDIGTDTDTPIGSYTVLAVCRLDSFPSSYPAMVGFKTSGARQIIFFSNDASYQNVAMGSFGATVGNTAKFALSGSVTGIRRNLVFRRSSSSEASTSFDAWGNGAALTRTAANAFGADPGGNSAVGQNTTTSLGNDWDGDFWLFALFNTAIPDAVCRSLSENPWQLFEPRRIWMPVPTAAPSGFLPAWIRRPQRTIGAGVI